jgi:hypothetical protein
MLGSEASLRLVKRNVKEIRPACNVSLKKSGASVKWKKALDPVKLEIALKWYKHHPQY